MTEGLRKLNLCLLAAVGAAALTSAGSMQAQAQDMQSLQSQISSMQAAIKQLERQVANAQAQAAAAQFCHGEQRRKMRAAAIST